MNLLYAKKENGNFQVDFKEPPCATPEQIDQIKNLLDNIGIEFEIRGVEEKKKKGGKNLSGENKIWTSDQKEFLFRVDLTEDEIAVKTGHSSFGVRMKRGEVLSEFSVWCKENGSDPLDEENRKKFLRLH